MSKPTKKQKTKMKSFMQDEDSVNLQTRKTIVIGPV